MTMNATQPDQAEGERDDDAGGAARDKGSRGAGQGVSADQPAEGADDIPAGGDGSPG